MSYSNNFETICNNHVMLLYNSADQYNEIVINFINKGLERGHFCVYISKDTDNNESNYSLSNITSKILNYHEHLLQGNLQIVNYRPYYESVISGDLSLVRKLMGLVDETMIQRNAHGKRNGILVIKGISSSLLRDKYFRECIEVEKLVQDVHSKWVQNSQNITIICPYCCPSFSIIKGDSLIHIKNKIVNLHTMTIDL